jgi:hypothetical protein
MFVNRMHSLLDDLIGPMQSDFVPGRLITNNALIAFECLHALNNEHNSCKRFDALKLDLTKAYDRVDWNYPERVLSRLGFHSKWTWWIMECVTTVRYSVCFNNVHLNSFVPT